MKKVIVSLCVLLAPCISNGMLVSEKKFFEACGDGNEGIVENHLKAIQPEAKKGLVNRKNDDEETPLSLAATKCHIGIMKLLCKHGADPNQPDGFGLRPLESLVNFIKTEEQKNRPKGAQILIEHNADVNHVTDDDTSLLADAVFINHIPLVQTLIEAKADPNLGALKKHPLYIAAKEEKCSEDMVTTLLNAGAQVNETMIQKAKKPEIKELLEQAYNKQKEKK